MFRHHARRHARLNVSWLEDRTVPSTLVWVGDVNGNWGANSGGNTNWFNSSTNTDNVLPQDGDDLQFPATGANRTNTNDLSNLVANSISFSGIDYQIGGNGLNLNGLSDLSSSGFNVLSLPIALNNTVSVSVPDVSSRLTLNGVISGASGVTKTGNGVLRLGGFAANTYTGTTTVSAGLLELNKTGTLSIVGTLIINGGGASELANNQILDTAVVNVGAVGTFFVSGASDVIRVLSVVGGDVRIDAGELDVTNVAMTGGNIISTGGGSLGLFGDVTTNSAATSATISGNLRLGGITRTFTIADGAAAVDLDVSAAISSIIGEGLTKVGAGTLRLDGSVSNTYTGPTTFSGGGVELGKTGGAIPFAGDLMISGGIARLLGNNQIPDTSAVTVNGTLDLNNFSETVGGTLTLNSGTVTIGSGMLTAGPIAGTGTISATGIGSLILQGNVSGNLTVNANFDLSVDITGHLTVNGNVNLGANVTGQLTVTGNLNLGSTTRTFGSLSVTGVVNGTGNAGVTSTGGLSLGGSASNTYTGLTTVTGSVSLSKSGGAQALLGDLIVNNGNLQIFSAGNQIADTAAVTLNNSHITLYASEVIGALILNGSGASAGGSTLTAGPVTLTGSTASANGGGRFILKGNLTSNPSAASSGFFDTLDLGGATRTFDIADGSSPLDLDMPCTIIGAGVLIKTGPGTMRLLNDISNTYQSGTTVNAGTLLLLAGGGNFIDAIPNLLTINGGIVRAMANNQLSNGSNVTINTGGTFDQNGQTDTIGSMSVAGGTLTTGGTSAGRLTVFGISFSSTSTLAMRLVGANTSDKVTVNGGVGVGGTLQLSSSTTVPVGTVIRIIDNLSATSVSGTFTNLPQGATVSAGGQFFTISYTGGTGNDVVLTRIATPLVVTGTQVNDGSAQRSRITSLQVSFSLQVTFAGAVSDAFTLTRNGGGSVSFQASASVIGGVTVVTIFNFTGAETDTFGSLNDGRYTLTAIASQISSGGMQLNGGTNYTFTDAQGLFRFFGDVNGDQNVNGLDFGFFKNAFGTQVGDANYLSYLDFNGDGVINGFDFGQFRTRFGTMLP